MSLAKKLRPHAVNLALVAAALAAFGAVVVLDRRTASTGEVALRKKKLLEVWRGDDVSEVVLAAHGRTTRIARGAPAANGQRPWELELDGRRFPGDEQRIDGLLASIELGVFDRTIAPESVDRAAFRLDSPTATLAIAMGPRSYRIALGGPAPSPRDASYAEVNGRGVVVISKALVAALDVAPESLRSRALLAFPTSELGALRLDGEDGPRHLVRASWGGGRGGGFRFDGSSPEGRARADAVVLERVLGSLDQLRADDFVTDAVADAASKPEVTVTLVSKAVGVKPTVLELGGPCPGRDDHVLAIRREPSRVSACVGKPLVDALGVPASALVDRHLVGAPLDEVVEVELAAGSVRLELARSGPAWHERLPTDRAVDAATGRALVEALLRVTAERFATPSEAATASLDKPRATVRIHGTAHGPNDEDVAATLFDAGAAAERVEVLEVGGEVDGLVAVRRVEDGLVALIPPDDARVLFPNDLVLRPLKILSEPVGRVRSLRIEAGGHVQRVEQLAATGWRYVEPAGQTIDQGLANDVATMVGTLTAARWVADKEDASFGLATPRVVVDAVIGDEGDGKPRKARIVLGAPTADGAFARLDGGPVFAAPRLFEETATRWLADRNALLFVPADLARVTLEADGGKKKLVIERVASGAWQTTGPGAESPNSAERAAAVREAFSQLLPEGAVTVGKAEPRQGVGKPRLTVTLELLPGKAAVGAPAPVDGKPLVTRLFVGAADAWQGTSVVYVRREGVEATYAVARARVQPLLDALQVP